MFDGLEFNSAFYGRVQNKGNTVASFPRIVNRARFKKKFFGVSKTISAFKKYIKHFVHIRINSNNTIATLTNLKGQVKYNLSAGKLKLRSSKRTYKYIYGLVLKKFFDYLFREHLRKGLYFKISVPKNLRKALLRRILRFRRRTAMVEFLRLLPFNGCRAPKKRRKKRQGLRVFKT
jgi:ribosomal protein S11